MARPAIARQFLDNSLLMETDECVLWPFCRDQLGYGMVSFKRGGSKMRRAHNLVCELAHGPAPEGRTDAAHRCNTPACINKRHLRWANRSENLADGVRPPTYGNMKLTYEEVCRIRASTEKSSLLASQFGVSYYTIWDIRADRSWSNPPAFVTKHAE